jgi:hypothetical protein
MDAPEILIFGDRLVYVDGDGSSTWLLRCTASAHGDEVHLVSFSSDPLALAHEEEQDAGQPRVRQGERDGWHLRLAHPFRDDRTGALGALFVSLLMSGHRRWRDFVWPRSLLLRSGDLTQSAEEFAHAAAAIAAAWVGTSVVEVPGSGRRVLLSVPFLNWVPGNVAVLMVFVVALWSMKSVGPLATSVILFVLVVGTVILRRRVGVWLSRHLHEWRRRRVVAQLRAE